MNERDKNIKMVFVNIGLLTSRYEYIVNKVHKNDGLTFKQIFTFLMASKEFDHDPTLTELSHILASSHQNTKVILLQLEKKGYVKLYIDDFDKRMHRIRIVKSKLNHISSKNCEDVKILCNLFDTISTEDLKTTNKVIEILNSAALDFVD